MAVRCTVELQLADGPTGRNLSTTLYPRAMIIRRRGGLELMSDDPPLHKAIKVQAHKYEVYSSFAAMGKLALIRRERTRITQFNLREGDPDEMVALRDFCIRSGGISKSRVVAAAPAPTARKPVAAPPSTPVRDRRAGVKRSRSALADLTNSSQSPGDFFQLPPVGRRARGQAGVAAPPPPLLCFESSAWVRGVTETIVLKEIFRQRDDEFVRILNAFRVGRPTASMINKLNERYKPNSDSDSDDAIHIFSHNDDVLRTNTRALDELGGKRFNYVSADRGKTEFLSACPAQAKLSLKKNARVLLIKTLSPVRGLVNGSRGIVEGFTPQSNLPIVRFSNGVTEIIGQEEFTVSVADTVLASRRQLPLALAWATSIHKSQGLSFDAAVLDLSRVFEFGQAYVALSRVRSLEGLRLRARVRDKNGGRLLADARVVDFYESISGY
ncbi:hypothetical protein PR002_g14636 [Phytophthora rubi]|uniref:DNA helicase Pif1-like 2B domain-containing protein n=1 Tax=Phytophthora rubi TaxID=129364 RepID=A0A6A3L094_9STRA|nr:hypothetical protein PR002_g14636 [Phytophthora rubi]